MLLKIIINAILYKNITYQFFYYLHYIPNIFNFRYLIFNYTNK